MDNFYKKENIARVLLFAPMFLFGMDFGLSQEYQNKTYLPALMCSQNWSIEKAESIVGYPVQAKFHKIPDEDLKNESRQRLSIFSPGLYKPSENRPTTMRHSEWFTLLRDKESLRYSGDYFIYDTPYLGVDKNGFEKKITFGQKEDAY